MDRPSVLLSGYKGVEYTRQRAAYLRRRFAFLVDDFGCEEVPAQQDDEVRFRNATTLVILLAQWEGPYVGFDRAADSAGRRYGSIDLWGLMKVRKSPRLDEISREPLPAIDKFEFLARALPECAADVMRGDFSIAPQVEGWWRDERRETEEWRERVELQNVEARAAAAFRQGDFAAVVSILTPCEARLSDVQLRKLDIARRRSR
jgi:hypothetical protein